MKDMRVTFGCLDIGVKFEDVQGNEYIRIGIVYSNTDECENMTYRAGQDRLFDQKAVKAVCINSVSDKIIEGAGHLFDSSDMVIIKRK